MGQRRQVVIPREMLEALKLQAGDFVAFAERENGVLIKPRRVGNNPDDTLTPAGAKIVRRGEAQLKRGESKPWRVVKMRFRAELSREACKHLAGSRLEGAAPQESRSVSDHLHEVPSRGVVEVSAILIRSKDTYN